MSQNYLHATQSDPEMEELHQIFSLEYLEKQNRSLKTQLRSTETDLVRYNEELKNKCEMRDTELYEARILTEKAYTVQESEIRFLELDLNEAREEIIRVKRKLDEKESESSNINPTISQVAQLQSLNNRNQAEIDSLKETVECLERSNNDKAAELKHLKERPNTKIQNLLATVQDSEHIKASLIERNRLIADQLGQSESDKNSLKAKNNDLQESKKTLTANKAKLESLNKKQHKDIGHLCLTVQDLHCKVRECHKAIRDQNVVVEQQKKQLKQVTEKRELLPNASTSTELTELQSLTAGQQQSICELKEVVEQQKQANVKYLSVKKQLEQATEEFQKKEIFLCVQIETMGNELVELRSLTAEQQQSISNLKEVVEQQKQDNVRHLSEKKQLKQTTEEFQKKKISLSVQNESMSNELAKLKSLTAEQQQSICNLKEVVEQQKQANVKYLSVKKQLDQATEDFQKKKISLSVQNESMGNELAKLKSLTAKQQQSICNLKDQLQMSQQEQTPACHPCLRDQRCILGENTGVLVSTPEVPTDVNTPEDGTDEITPVDPAAEVQARPRWYRCARVILRVGVYVGVRVAVALLVTGACQMMTSSSCFPLDLNCKLLESFTSFHYITPPPF